MANGSEMLNCETVSLHEDHNPKQQALASSYAEDRL
jgi:hypothetical protein